MKNTVKIKDKEYPCRITMGAMLRFRKETGHDISQMLNNDVGDMVTFLWCCIVSACKADSVEFGLDLMTFADGLDPQTLNEFFMEMDASAGSATSDAEKKTGNPTS